MKNSIMSVLVLGLYMATIQPVYSHEKSGDETVVLDTKNTKHELVQKVHYIQLSDKELQRLHQASQNQQVRYENREALKKLYVSKQHIDNDVKAAKYAKDYIDRCTKKHEMCVKEAQIKLYQEQIKIKHDAGLDTHIEEEEIRQLKGGQR